MSEDLAALAATTEAALATAADLRAWDAVRVGVLGRNGSLTALLKGLGQVPAEDRKARGAALNELKGRLEALIEARRTALEAAALDARLLAERLDVSLPPRPGLPGGEGGIHPITRTMEELTALFGRMAAARCCGPIPPRCRRAPCWGRSRRSASSSPAAPSAPTMTRRIRPCSIRWRGWSSTVASIWAI